MTAIRITFVGMLAMGVAAAQPSITSVVNAASGILPGLPNAGIAQGSIFLIVGSNLGPGTISIAATPFQSTTLSNTSVSVTVQGQTVSALMYYTSAAQVAALLPSATPVGNGTITVTYNGQPSAQSPITVVANNLGIFTVTSDGEGAGIVTYPDYSLVSVLKAPNCGGPSTTCGAANPGDTLILWATGLGPVSSDSAVGVALPNVPLKLWIGGVQANVLYQGRGCCVGEDQINFVVPQNVPLGCAVPLAVQIGNEISNYTAIPVSAVGNRTCTPVNAIFTSTVIQELTNPTGPITIGRVKVQRGPAFENGQGGQQGNIDSFSGKFMRQSVPFTYQPFIVTYLDTPPAGTCVVANNLQGNNGPLAELAGLDAGPNFKLTGPNGTQTVSSNNGGVYSATLSSTGSFLSPGNYTLTGSGGADVGPINLAFAIPAPPTLTGAAAANNVPVTRANGFTVTWTGGTAGFVQILGSSPIDNTATNGASFICTAPASAGSLTIPPSVLLALPAGSNGNWDFISGALPDVTFTATGLNLGFLTPTYDTPIFTTLQ